MNVYLYQKSLTKNLFYLILGVFLKIFLPLKLKVYQALSDCTGLSDDYFRVKARSNNEIVTAPRYSGKIILLSAANTFYF